VRTRNIGDILLYGLDYGVGVGSKLDVGGDGGEGRSG